MVDEQGNPQLIVITGMSGAGKTVAIQSLEDLDFFCIDNLPPALLPKFAELVGESKGKIRNIALVIDLRGRDFFADLFTALTSLEKIYKINYNIIFLEASKSILVQRYKESRRRHPLSPEGTPLSGIAKESELLEEIKSRAHFIIDTTYLTSRQLKEKMIEYFANLKQKQLTITFMSFGFKHGIPIDADLVFDVRFLPNPHYVDHLRPFTGREKSVVEYVMRWTETRLYLEKLVDLLSFSIPYYHREGKAQLVIAIGCTGGKHRSVVISEYLYRKFHESEQCHITHRDIEKEGS